MFFLWLEKFLAGFSQALGEIFSEASSQIYIHMTKFAVWGFFSQGTDIDFCIQQDTVWVEGVGLSHQLFSPQNIFFFISNLLLTVLGLLLFAPVCA